MHRDTIRLLQRLKLGDDRAEEEFVSTVYSELKRLARSHLSVTQGNQTLQPTVLVHEAYLKLTDAADIDWHGRQHFFRHASRVMRQVLVDHAQSRMAQESGGDEALLTPNEAFAGTMSKPAEVLALSTALDRLHRVDEQACQAVELRFFGGLSVQETAETMGIPAPTVEQEWDAGCAWLKRELGLEREDEATGLDPGPETSANTP